MIICQFMIVVKHMLCHKTRNLFKIILNTFYVRFKCLELAKVDSNQFAAIIF